MSVSQIERLHEEKGSAIPIYLVVDTSWSMNMEGKIDAANEIMPTVIKNCQTNPLVDNAARFCLIEFNTDAQVVVPLAKGSHIQAPTLTAQGGTSYTKAFQLLRKQIEDDYQALTADDFILYRPSVIFITDGDPICDAAERAAAFAELTNVNFRRRPNMAMFGVGSAVSNTTLKQYTVGRGRAMATREGANVAVALENLAQMLAQSFEISSGPGDIGAEGLQFDVTDFLPEEDGIWELN